MRLQRKSNNNQRISLQAIALMVYFILMPVDLFKIGSLGTILRVYAFFLVGIFILTGKTKLRSDKILKLGLTYLFCCLISLMFSINFDSSLSTLITLCMNFTLIFVTCNLIIFNPKEVNLLHTGIILGSLVTVLLTLCFSNFSDRGRLTMAVANSVADQNYLNGYLFFAISFATICLFYKNKARVLSAISIFLALFFTLYTGSRGALLAEVMIIFFAIIGNFVISKKKIWYFFGTFALLLLLIFGFDYLITLLPQGISIRFSPEFIAVNGTSDRTEIWKHLVSSFFSGNPLRMLFGYGVGTSGYFNTFDNHVAHNAFIDTMIGVGIIGLIVYIALLVYCIKISIRNKNYEFCICMLGFIMLSMSLSLITYKPIYNCIMMISIMDVSNRRFENAT